MSLKKESKGVLRLLYLAGKDILMAQPEKPVVKKKRTILDSAKPVKIEDTTPIQKKTGKAKNQPHRVNLIEYHLTSLKLSCFSFDAANKDKLAKQVKEWINAVLESESPISLSLLTHRIMYSCAVNVTTPILDYMRQLLGEMKIFTTDRYGNPVSLTESNNPFLWKQSIHPDSYSYVRMPTMGIDRRDVSNILTIEAANAICYVLQEFGSASEPELLREGAKLLGYAHLGSLVATLMNDAFGYACSHSWIKKGANDSWVLA